MTPRRIAAVIAVAAGCTACTPEQSAEWFGWRRHDRQAAHDWLDSPEGQQSLTDPSVDVPAPLPPQPDVRRGDVWDRVAECESGRTWSYNGGSGYDGGLQFLPSTWRAYGGREFAEYAWGATREQQIAVANRVLEDVGWIAWPTCSRKLGLR